MLDGRIFLASGARPPAVFDPRASTWTLTPALPMENVSFPGGTTLVTLTNGDVMLGGMFLFNPTTWTWRIATNLHPGGSALALRDGRVLFFGVDGTMDYPVTCRSRLSLYDPSTDSSQAFGDTKTCLSKPLMYQQTDGRVLLHGGCATNGNDGQAGGGNFWVVDPKNLTMTYASLQAGSVAGSCSGGTVLANGEVLFAGSLVWAGLPPFQAVWGSDVVRFDLLDASMKVAAPLPAAMAAPRSIVTIGPRVLVVAGTNGSLVRTTLLYDPAADRWTNLTTWPGSYVQDSTVMADVSVFAIDNSGDAYRLVPPPAPRTPFTDIAGSIFKADIEWLYTEGITSGCTATKYCPDGYVTREQMASFLARALKLTGSAPDAFTDDNASIHEPNINLVAKAGITTGCAPGKYCPTAKVSREQMASFLARALKLTGSAPDAFTDDNASIHEPNINLVAKAGITTGCAPGKYCPTANVTRGQMAAFLRRALVKYPQAAAAPSAVMEPAATPAPSAEPTPAPPPSPEATPDADPTLPPSAEPTAAPSPESSPAAEPAASAELPGAPAPDPSPSP